MNFILWTLVWFGLWEIGHVLEYGFPYYNERKRVGSNHESNMLIWLILWIGLYLLFIK